jgi:hypothetical protein
MYSRRQFIKYGATIAVGGSAAMIISKLSRKSRSYYKIITPDNNTQLLLPDNAQRIIVYCHGVGETRNAPQTDVLKYPLILEMLANKWAILSSNAGGEDWGNAAAIAAYQNAIILGIYPVTNLANMFTTGFKANIKSAFGFSLDSDYATATAGHDPMLLSNSLFTGRKLKMWASYGDTIVARSANADALLNKLNGVATVQVVTATGDHGHTSHFDIPSAISFFNS